MDRVRVSKRLAYVLRHAPGSIGLELDAAGWVGVEDLLAALARSGTHVGRADLVDIVEASDKRRFAVSADGARIRASQGHSVAVDLELPPSVPPETLFHGTVARYLAAIRAEGLRARSRTHVHLSADRQTAATVGARRGRPVVLEVRARALCDAGQPFFLADNGVWLVDAVPPAYLVIPAPGPQ